MTPNDTHHRAGGDAFAIQKPPGRRLRWMRWLCSSERLIILPTIECKPHTVVCPFAMELLESVPGDGVLADHDIRKQEPAVCNPTSAL